MQFQSAAAPARTAGAVRPISIFMTSFTLMLLSMGSAAASEGIPPVYHQTQAASARQIVVNGFVIEGVTTEEMVARMPEIEALVERERQRLLGLDQLDPTDFDDAERARILAFMQRVAQDDSADANVDGYRDLVSELRRTQSHRAAGLTVDQINAVAASVTDYFRAHGYFLARAIIPAQDVNGGVVRIQVFEGRFGEAVVEGNGSYSSEGIQEIFEGVEGDVITPESIEGALVALQGLPGLEASTTWQPGSEVGSSDLLVSVTDEDRFSGYALMDNHLADSTGTTRVLLGLSINNVATRRGDTLSLGVIQSLNPSDDTFVHFDWRMPLVSQDDALTIGWGQDTFDVGEFAILGIGGRSTYARIGWDHQVRRSFHQNMSFGFDLATQRATIFIGNDIPVTQDKITVVGAQMNYDSVNSDRDLVKNGWLRLDFGLPNFLGSMSQADAVAADIAGVPTTRIGVDAGGTYFADSSFSKLSWDYQSARRLGSHFEVTFRMQGQYSPDVLPSMHTFSVGGPGAVRGLPMGVTSGSLAVPGFPSSFQADSAMVGSVDFGYRPGWYGAPVFSVFYDQASTYVSDPLLAADHHRAYGSLGWGIRYNISGFFVRLMSAKMHEGPDPGGVQWWFDIGSSF